MILRTHAELYRLQRDAVIALKLLCLDTEVRNAEEPRALLAAAIETRRTLKFARYLSTQIGVREAAHATYERTRIAWESLGALVAECELEIGDGEDFASPLVRECAEALTR